MISHLVGTVTMTGPAWVVIDLGGFGLHALCTPSTAANVRIGERTTLHTALIVREDSLTLYGFSDPAEREAFHLVQSASGVGPKLALSIVSVLSPSELSAAIMQGDLARLCAVPGIGQKGAQRIVLELKDKVAALSSIEQRTTQAEQRMAWRDQVSEGLQGLGWSARDAEAACDKVAGLAEADPATSVATLMRAALASLAKR